jgi:lipid II:glycine glycyltransferase (peptidoglycan interpeptide bridge formation enzyme)
MSSIKLTKDIQVIVDGCTETEWNVMLRAFSDATINQTWSFGASLSGENNLSHLLVKSAENILAVAQVRLYTLPLIGKGLAYLPWGPLWHLKESALNTDNLRYMLCALIKEYVERRGLYLRILPHIWETDPNAEKLKNIFSEEGFDWKQSTDMTLHVDLSPSLESIRKGFHQKWRNLLNSAEKHGLSFIEGRSQQIFNEFMRVYRSMIERKNYDNPVDIEKFAAMFERLPEELRPLVILTGKGDDYYAGGVFSTIGDTGIFLLGAVNEEGMKTKASYLVQWRVINYLKENEFKKYDLGGVDPEETPNTFHFKAGLCGKNPAIERRLGEFNACTSYISKLAVKFGESYRSHRYSKSKIKEE